MVIGVANRIITVSPVGGSSPLSYSVKGYLDEVKQHCLTLYVNGMGFRAIERSTGVNHNTVMNWVKQSGSIVSRCARKSDGFRLSTSR